MLAEKLIPIVQIVKKKPLVKGKKKELAKVDQQIEHFVDALQKELAVVQAFTEKLKSLENKKATPS